MTRMEIASKVKPRSRAAVAVYCLLSLSLWQGSDRACGEDEPTAPAAEEFDSGFDSSSDPAFETHAETPSPQEAIEGNGSDKGKLSQWETYSEGAGSSQSVAEEITGGVRVEDIVEPPADYRYAAFGRPDPFVPPMITKDTSVKSVEIPIVSPLQRFRLDELQLVGVWQQRSGERKAMVMTPQQSQAGQGIIVKVGDPIGNRGGKILSIGDEFLTVREFILAPDSTRQFQDQQLFMGQRKIENIPGRIRFNPGSSQPDMSFDKQNLNANELNQAETAKDSAAGGSAASAEEAPVNGSSINAVPTNLNGSGSAPAGQPAQGTEVTPQNAATTMVLPMTSTPPAASVPAVAPAAMPAPANGLGGENKQQQPSAASTIRKF